LNADATWRGVARPREGELLVSEVFGPTLQGEGPNTGRAAAFIRLGGCNLSCRWCDTAFTWDQNRYDLAHELTVRRTEDVAGEAIALGPRLVILTGGEPGLQAGEAARLMRILKAAGCRVEVETSGTVPLGAMVDDAALLVISPKLSNAGVQSEARLRWKVLHDLATLPQTLFKFVVADADELTEVDAVAQRLSLQSSKIWIMPEATERDVLLQRMALLAGPVAERGWSLSNRLQVLLWSNERGHLYMSGRGDSNWPLGRRIIQHVEAKGATVLLSGGVDSAVVLSMLSVSRRDVKAIWIDYGQPAAAAEREASKAIASNYGTVWSELVVAGLVPPAAGEFPGRNDVLVALAAAAAPGRSVAIGVHAGTGYADCSPPWVEAWQDLLTVQRHGVVSVLAPLANLTKVEVYALAHQMGVPTSLTHSCETSGVPCGRCSSCADRRLLDACP